MEEYNYMYDSWLYLQIFGNDFGIIEFRILGFLDIYHITTHLISLNSNIDERIWKYLENMNIRSPKPYKDGSTRRGVQDYMSLQPCDSLLKKLIEKFVFAPCPNLFFSHCLSTQKKETIIFLLENFRNRIYTAPNQTHFDLALESGNLEFFEFLVTEGFLKKKEKKLIPPNCVSLRVSIKKIDNWNLLERVLRSKCLTEAVRGSGSIFDYCYDYVFEKGKNSTIPLLNFFTSGMIDPNSSRKLHYDDHDLTRFQRILYFWDSYLKVKQIDRFNSVYEYDCNGEGKEKVKLINTFLELFIENNHSLCVNAFVDLLLLTPKPYLDICNRLIKEKKVDLESVRNQVLKRSKGNVHSNGVFLDVLQGNIILPTPSYESVKKKRKNQEKLILFILNVLGIFPKTKWMGCRNYSFEYNVINILLEDIVKKWGGSFEVHGISEEFREWLLRSIVLDRRTKLRNLKFMLNDIQKEKERIKGWKSNPEWWSDDKEKKLISLISMKEKRVGQGDMIDRDMKERVDFLLNQEHEEDLEVDVSFFSLHFLCTGEKIHFYKTLFLYK